MSVATIDLKRMKRFGIATAILLAAVGCGSPSIGPSDESFKAVDALYTAVSLREVPLLDRCDQVLKTLRKAGKLPESAANALDSIVAEARAGGWEKAQGRLGRFMRDQRPESS